MLLVVVAIVLLIATEAWKKVMPTASQAIRPDSPQSVRANGEEEAAEEIRSGALPDLNDMKERTGAHSQDVEDTLEEAQ